MEYEKWLIKSELCTEDILLSVTVNAKNILTCISKLKYFEFTYKVTIYWFTGVLNITTFCLWSLNNKQKQMN